MIRKMLIIIIVAWFALSLHAGGALAASVKFGWNPATSADVSGYRLYWKNKTTSALTKLGNDITGKTTATATVDIPTIEGADKYVVVAKAYDLAGNESKESNEATKDGTTFIWADTTPPEAPGMLQVLQQIADALNKIATIMASAGK